MEYKYVRVKQKFLRPSVAFDCFMGSINSRCSYECMDFKYVYMCAGNKQTNSVVSIDDSSIFFFFVGYGNEIRQRKEGK